MSKQILWTTKHFSVGRSYKPTNESPEKRRHLKWIQTYDIFLSFSGKRKTKPKFQPKHHFILNLLPPIRTWNAFFGHNNLIADHVMRWFFHPVVIWSYLQKLQKLLRPYCSASLWISVSCFELEFFQSQKTFYEEPEKSRHNWVLTYISFQTCVFLFL